VKRGLPFWAGAAFGWALIGWGLRGVFEHSIDTRPASLGRFVVGGLLLHDLVWAPLLIAGGAAVARITPPRWRAAAQATTFIGGCAALFAWPEVRDYARALHNPTSLPRNYTASLVAIVAATGCVAVAWALLAARRASGRGRHRPPRPASGRG
jgi:hypothetical protein